MGKLRRKFDEDDFDIAEDIMSGVGDMKQYEAYEQFDVEAKLKDLASNAKQLILQVSKVYLDNARILNEDYIKAIGDVEVSNLTVMLKQVKYSEHMLDSLMRQLDAGGYVDPGIYDTINKLQKSTIQITLDVSRYVRTLPEYFKFVSQEVRNIEAESTKVLSLKNNDITDIDSEDVEDSQKTFDLSSPIRGTRELMLAIADSRKDLAEAIAQGVEVEPTPISITEDFDDDEKNEDDEDYDEYEDIED